MAWYEDVYLKNLKERKSRDPDRYRYQFVQYGNGATLILESHYDSEKKKLYTIREVLKAWGALEHHTELIEYCKRALGWRQNTVMHVSVETRNMRKEPNRQKLLYFRLMDKETGKQIYDGGVCFHMGDMSTHT